MQANLKSEIKKVTKHVPADVTAIIFWLKNRQPAKWNDKREMETKDIEIKVVFV